VPAGVSPVYVRSGTRVLAGRTWRTACSRTASYGYRCRASYRGVRYQRNPAGRWGPVASWVPARTSYFDTVGPSWAGHVRATPGPHAVAGTRYLTRCNRATGARTCTTWVLAEQIGRRRVGPGYVYYRFRGWQLSSLVALSSAR